VSRDRGDEFYRVDLGRPGRIHVGDDRPGPEGGREQGEEREGRLIDIGRGNPVIFADQPQLGGEDRVLEPHPLRRPGRAGGEDDRRQVVRRRDMTGKNTLVAIDRPADVGPEEPGREAAAEEMADGGEGLLEQPGEDQGPGDADQD